MEKIKFAIIGFGHIGMRHFEEINSFPNAEVVAIIDLDESKNSEINVPFFTSLSAFFEKKLIVDVVCICSPNGNHFEHAAACLEKGIHIILEKPVCLNLAEGYQLIKLAKQNGVKIFPVLQNRFTPANEFVKSLVAGNKCGKIFQIIINCYWNRDERYYGQSSWRGTKSLDGGTLFTQFSHFIDVLIWIFGDINILTKSLNNYSHKDIIEFEDSGMIQFNLLKSEETMGLISYSTSVLNRNMESSLTLLSENISLKVSGQYMNELVFFESKAKIEIPDFATISSNQYGFYSGSANYHFKVIEEVLLQLSNQSTNLPSMEEALKSIDFIRKVYDSE